MSDDEEDDERFNQFEDGHWIWDPIETVLQFIRYLPTYQIFIQHVRIGLKPSLVC